MKAPSWVAAVLCILVIGGCDDTPSVPEPGRATLTLRAPEGRAEGAAVLRISGGSIASPAVAGGEVFTRAGVGSTDVVVVLDTPGTISVTFQVDDLGALPSAQVLQVSGPSDDLRPSLQGYAVTVTL